MSDKNIVAHCVYILFSIAALFYVQPFHKISVADQNLNPRVLYIGINSASKHYRN